MASKKAPKKTESKSSTGDWLLELVQRLRPADRPLAMGTIAEVIDAASAGDTGTLQAIRDAIRARRLDTESIYLAVQRECERYMAAESDDRFRGDRPGLRELRASDLGRALRDVADIEVSAADVLRLARTTQSGRRLACKLLAVSGYDRRLGESLEWREARMARALRDAQPPVRRRRDR